MSRGTLISLDVPKGVAGETESGLQARRPRIYGAFADEGCSKDVAYVVIHPTSNFLGHYLLEPMQKRGRAILALNTRYAGNDSMLIMERALMDLGRGIRFLREQGYESVCLIGNSGGGSLAALYQAEAEHLTISSTPDGLPIDISPSDLPPVDSIALVAAHIGRALTYTLRLDAAVIDENDLMATDPALDIFDPKNGPSYSSEFVQQVRFAQIARNRRITQACQAAIADGSVGTGGDRAFIVNRTSADPRMLDASLDRNDRREQTAKGQSARDANFSSNGLGRFCTMRSWLSQWSWDLSRANGPACLARTSVPVFHVYHTADETSFPSYAAEWDAASGDRIERHDIVGAGHYPDEAAVETLADMLAEWGCRKS